MNPSTMVTDEHRTATCSCCGAEFTQVRLAARLYTLSAQAAQRAGSKTSAMQRDIPDGWVPLYCVPCERYDLARTGPIEQFEKDVGRVAAEYQRDLPHWKERRSCCDARMYAAKPAGWEAAD